MSKNYTTNYRFLWAVFAVLALAALACGEASTPELVATSEVEQSGTDAAVEESSSANNDQENEDTAISTEASSETESDSEASTEAVTESSNDTYNVGDVVSIGDNILTILGWEEFEGNDFSSPEEGNRFVAVEAIIVNQSDKTISISTIVQMSLKDSTAQTYDVDFLATTAIDSGGLDGELAPGESIRGKVGFQIPVDAADLQFVFNASFFDSSKTFVNLGSEPISVEPPTEIAGATEQQTFSIGEVISIGDSSLLVLGWKELEEDDFTKPEEGKKFLGVEIIIVNQSNTSANISSLLQMTLKDDLSQAYDVDFSASTLTKTGGIDGELVAGEKVRGTIGYQVPIDASGLLFVFDADVFGFGKVNVALGETATVVEAPLEITGEQEVATFNVGDTVAIDSLNITLNEITNPEGGDFANLDEGNQFLVVDITLENIGSEPEFVSSILQMQVKDQDGFVYTVDIFAPTESSPEGEIVAGETIRGQIGYQVPVDAETLFFVFDEDVFTDGKVFYLLP